MATDHHRHIPKVSIHAIWRRGVGENRPAVLRMRIGLGTSLVGLLMLTGCGSTAATPIVTATVTATSPPSLVVFDPQTSGRFLADRISARARPKTPGVTISAVECKNFPDIKVDTHTDCQMVVNGVKRGYLATFTQRDGHYEIKAQDLTW